MLPTKRYAPFILGVTFVIGITWFVRQRRKEIGSLSDWQQVLIKRHGTEKAGQMVAAVRQQHADLVVEAPLPNNQALRWHLKANILPGLALYRVLLQEHDGDQQAALAEVDEAFRARTLEKNRLLLHPYHSLFLPEHSDCPWSAGIDRLVLQR